MSFRTLNSTKTLRNVSTDADWREPRRHLNHAFNLNVLKGFIPIFSSYSEITVNEMEKHSDTKVAFDIHPFAAQLVFRTVSGIYLSEHASLTFDMRRRLPR